MDLLARLSGTEKETPLTDDPNDANANAAAEMVAVMHLTPERIIAIMASLDVYVALTRALLGDEDAGEYLRGIARIGLMSDIEPGDEMAVQQHARVMATLERLGLEPLDEDVVVAKLNASARGLKEEVDRRKAAEPKEPLHLVN